MGRHFQRKAIKLETIKRAIGLISELDKEEREIIRDIPDHSRRRKLHHNKLEILSKLLNKSIQGKRWVNKKRIFSLTEELLKEINVKKGIVTDKVYQKTGFFNLMKRSKQLSFDFIGKTQEDEKKEIKISFQLYDELNRDLRKIERVKDLPKNTRKKVQELKNTFFRTRHNESLIYQIDEHINNLLGLFKELNDLQKQITTKERNILQELKSERETTFIKKIITDLINIDSQIKDLISFSKRLQKRIKQEFYMPFQNFHDEKLSMEESLIAITKQRKISLKDVELDYRTMVSADEVFLEYFDTLRDFGPELVEAEVFEFIKREKEKIKRKIGVERSQARTKILSLQVDDLTGALTRRPLLKEFNLLVESYKRSLERGLPKPFSILIMDIDKFKSINDTYGHAAGDNVLKFFANTVKKSIRSSIDIFRSTDKLFRFGGEEFIVTLPGESKAGALVVAERIRAAVLEKAGKKVNGNPEYFNQELQMPITVSIGVATYPDDCSINCTLKELIEISDAALYVAKKTGRNKVISASKQKSA
jgi:diguanylate cyclase (GGDEF)-like protein